MPIEKQMMIIAELRRDSRQHISGIAKRLGISRSTAHEHAIEAKKFIKMNTSLIDFAKLGYSLKMQFIFRIRNKKIISNFLLKSANVNSISRINNKRTLLVECLFRSTAEAYSFKEKLESMGISRVEMHPINEEIKKEAFTPCME